MEGGKEIQTQIIVITCKMKDLIPLDDFQGPGVAGSENGVRKSNSFNFPVTFKTHQENPAEKHSRFSSLSWLEGQLCRWDPVFLLYTWRQREPLGLPGSLAASLKSVAWQLPFYVHSSVVAPL